MKPGIAGKMHIRILSFLVLYSVAISPITKSAVAQSGLSGPFALTCDFLTQPLGIDSTKPRFAWKLKDGRTGAKQTAYEILVSSKPGQNGNLNGDVWDSGRVTSEQSVNASVRREGPSHRKRAITGRYESGGKTARPTH